jgi:hypothetical protein
MRSRVLSLINPLTRILLALRVAMLLLAPALTAHAAGGEWLPFPDSLVANQPITALLADRAGSVWAGTEERGLARWDGETWTAYTIAAGLPDMRVVTLFEDSRERLWVATGNGLGYFPPDRGAFRRIGAGGVPALPVTAMAEDAQGRVWLGTPRGLVAWREDGAFEAAGGLTDVRIASLAQSAGAVWAATSDGLWRNTGEGWAETPSPFGPVARLDATQGGPLHALADGAVWRLDGDAWTALPAPFDAGVTAFALAGERVWAARAGKAFATEGGITQSYEDAALPANGVADIAVGQDRAAWFASRAGLAAYRPGATPPTLDPVRVNGEVAGGEAVTLARNRINAVNVTVAGSRGGGPQAAVLFAQLDGIDAAPRIINGELSGTYRDVALPPGEHTLRVWAVDGDFNRSAEVRVSIQVPDLTYGPFGLAVPTEVVAPLLAVFSLVAVAAFAVFAALALGRRAGRRAAAREAARVRAILEMAGNPYEAGLGVEPDLRREEEREITAALTAPDGRSVLLLGPRGMGKTTLLRRLAETPNWGSALRLSGAYLDLAETREEEFFARAMNGLYEALIPRMVGERPRLDVQARAARPYGEREFAADAARLFASLRPIAGEPLNAVLLLDNAEALDAYGGAQRDAVRRMIVASAGGEGGVAQSSAGAQGGAAQGWIPASGGAPSPFRLVLAAETPPACLEGLRDALAVVQLPPLPAPALERLLLTPAGTAYEWDAEATRGAVALSQGRPGRLREIAERAVVSARRDGRVRIARTDVAPIRSSA